MRHISIDGFAGGGGASEGLRMAGIEVNIAINHDPAAIRMHTVNHPRTLHLTEDIFQVDLSKYLEADDTVDVMWASPDCTSHSPYKVICRFLQGVFQHRWLSLSKPHLMPDNRVH